MTVTPIIKMILWLKSIYNQASPNARTLITTYADNLRQYLKDKGAWTPEIEQIAGKNVSLEQALQRLNTTIDSITPEKKTITQLEEMGFDTTPLKQLLPQLFATTKTNTSTAQETLPTDKGTVVPQYRQNSTGQTAIRDYLKQEYGLKDSDFIWDKNKGLYLNTKKGTLYLGKPTAEQGTIENGTWYSSPKYIDTMMSTYGLAKGSENTGNTVKIRDYLKQAYGLKDDNIIWDNKEGLTVKVGNTEVKFGKPTQGNGIIVDGTWYTLPDLVDTVMASAGIKKQENQTTDITGEQTTGATGEQTTGTAESNSEDLTKLSMSEINLMMEQNKADILGKRYDDLIKDIQSGENDLLNKIHETYQGLIDSSIKNIESALKEATSALLSTKNAYDEQAKIAMEEIDKNVAAAKDMSKEEMAARGIYFSGLTTRAMNAIEAKGVSEKNKVRMEVLKYKAQIDTQIAVMTANAKMSESQLQNELLAKEALDKIAIITKDKDKIDAINMMKAQLEDQIAIDKANLPLAKELERRQNEIQSQQNAMEFFNKVAFPLLQLQYQDKWQEMSHEEKIMNLQQNFLSIMEQSNVDWARLGLDTEKARQEWAYKAAELSLQQAEFDFDKWYKTMQLQLQAAKSLNGTAQNTVLPPIVKQYAKYFNMSAEDINKAYSAGESFDISAATAVREMGEAVTSGDYSTITKAYSNLVGKFGAANANKLLSQIPFDNDRDRAIVALIAMTGGDLQQFATNVLFSNNKEISQIDKSLHNAVAMALGYGDTLNKDQESIVNSIVTDFWTYINKNYIEPFYKQYYWYDYSGYGTSQQTDLSTALGNIPQGVP